MKILLADEMEDALFLLTAARVGISQEKQNEQIAMAKKIREEQKKSLRPMSMELYQSYVKTGVRYLHRCSNALSTNTEILDYVKNATNFHLAKLAKEIKEN